MSLAYSAAQALLGSLHFPLQLDEAVYASQFARGVPRFPYAAHRAAGEGLLGAPLTMWTSSPGALRAYLMVLAGVLLYLAFWPWVKARGGPAAPIAAALFAFTWVSLRFAPTLLPNLPIAAGTVAAAGLVVHPGRRAWAGLFVAFTAMALVRPTDSAWVAVPVVAAMLLVPAWRRPARVTGVVAGLAVGAAAWVAEAYARFADPVTRLDAISTVNGAGGLHFTLLRYLETMSGVETCLPTTTVCGPVTTTSLLWWIGGLLLAAAGLVAAWRTRYRPALVLCVATATVFGAAYIVMSNWAVPRYLLPVFALLAIPAAEGVIALGRLVIDGRRRTVAACAAVALAGVPVSAGLQLAEAHRAAAATRAGLHWIITASDVLAERGVTGHCAVLGRQAPSVAYMRHCRAADMHDGLGARDASADVSAANVRRLRDQGLTVVLIWPTPPPTPGVTWRRYHIGGGQHMYVAR